MSLRVFLARTPAGLAGDAGRLRPHRQHARRHRHRHAARRHRRRRLGGQRRARSRPSPCCRRATAPYARVRPGVLPSRAGDNLFWLGRYVERAEGAMRLVRAYHVRLAETADPEAPLLAHFADYLDTPRHRPRRGGARRR